MGSGVGYGAQFPGEHFFVRIDPALEKGATVGHDVVPYALGLGLRRLVLCHESATETDR